MTTRLHHQLRDAWQLLRCQGSPIFTEEPPTTLEGSTARGLDVRLTKGRANLGWQCPNLLNNCARCPRFEAYWQGVRAGELGIDQRRVIRGANQVEPHALHRDREGAQVDHRNHQQVRAERVERVADAHSNANTVIHPIAPGVEHAQHRPQHGDGQRHRLQPDRINSPHPAILTQESAR